MKYKTMLTKILSKKELADIDVKIIKEDGILLDVLRRRNYILVVDWSGECEENELFNFFNNRVTSLSGKKLNILSGDVYKSFNETFTNPKKGDFLPFALNYFNEQLKSLGFRIVLLDMGNDAYYLLVASKNNANKLTKVKSDFWKFKELSFQNKTPLYVANCPKCGNIQFFGLDTDIEEKDLAGKCCSDCGTLFWDEDGNEMVNIEKYY